VIERSEAQSPDALVPGAAPAAPGGLSPRGLLERVPPHSLEAEMAVLGSVLLDGEMLGNVATLLKPEDFYRGAHAALYRVMLTLYDRSEPVDAITVFRECERSQLLDATGGRDYIAQLSSAVTSPAHAEHYAGIVREKAVARSLIAVSVEIQQAAFAEQGRGEDLIDLAQRLVHAVGEERDGGETQPISSLLHEAFDELQSGRPEVAGVRTGFLAFDDITTGWKPGELIIVAGRPSMGKTTFALNAAMNAAVHDKKRVAIFSLEMSAQNLVRNMLCAQARFPGQRLRRSGQFLTPDDLRKLADAAASLFDAPIVIDDSGALTPSMLRAKARRIQSRGGLDLVVVDYLQLMDAMGVAKSVESRQQEISYISRSLKGLARDLGVPVVAISQLNRDAEKREGHRPKLSDLRESGAIEQDADLICLLYRPYYYTRNESERVAAEVIVAKQRNGPTGIVNLNFFDEWMRFDNPAVER
jgi:replicative DNA helicase